MKASCRERGQLLILLALWLFFGGGASSALVVYDRPASETEKAIKRVIPDEHRRDVILTDIGQWEARQKERDGVVSENREKLFKILRRRDARLSDAEPIVMKLDETFRDMDQSFLNLRFRVKEQVTSGEWAEIVPRPKP